MSGDQFGRRYILQRTFIDYVKRLGVRPSFLENIVEFAERFDIVTPVARVSYPDPVVRRWFQERYPKMTVIEPIEPEGERLQAAEALRAALERDLMARRELPGDHPLDSVAPEFQQFVSTKFSRSTFTPWAALRNELFMSDGTSIGGSDGIHTYYHAWQVFPLVAFLRSGITVLYDIGTDHTWDSIADLRNRDDMHVTVNYDARAELKKLRDNAALFDAVAHFDDLRHRAFQHFARGADRESGRLSMSATRGYNARERDIARLVKAKATLSPKKLLAFIKMLCGLWADSRAHYPEAVTDAYKRTIGSTIELLRLVDRRYSSKTIVSKVGVFGGFHRPLLEVIFPHWVDEQRVMVEASLAQWIVPKVPQMPSPFAFATHDVAPFCDWLESRGFLQFYWHFRRLTDIGPFDHQIARTAATSEVVGLASLIEHLVTRALADRKPPAPHKGALFRKLRELLHQNHPALEAALYQNKDLVSTEHRTLRQQLDRIKRKPFAGSSGPVLRVLLRLVLIRNAASHGGLPGFRRDQMQKLIEALLIAAVVVWKVR